MELISEALFKKYSPVKDDTDIKKFTPFVIIAQQLYTDKILGDPLRVELETQIKTGTITPHNRALLEVLAPVVANYAVYQGLPFHWASISNKGLTIRKSENSEAVSVNDVGQLRAWLLNDCIVFQKRFIDYMCKCAKNYPLWSTVGYCGGCSKTSVGVNDLGITF